MAEEMKLDEPRAVQNSWTVQQFTEVAGKPWYALQERAPDGEVQRQYTGRREEIEDVARQLKVAPRELEATTEDKFYANMNRDSRDYELGRQFQADRSQGVRQDLAPYDLDRYSAGQQGRESEERARYEIQPKPAAQLSNTQIVNEAHHLHDRFQQLSERYETAPVTQRAEIREEMRPVVERERELRTEYTGRLQPEVSRDRVPEQQQIGVGY